MILSPFVLVGVLLKVVPAFSGMAGAAFPSGKVAAAIPVVRDDAF
jgi:hypothetical protein